MRTLHDSIRLFLAQKIEAALSAMGAAIPQVSTRDISEQFVEPPDSELGDLAFGCFILAKNLKKSPAALAVEMKFHLKTDENLIGVEAVGPYLNLTLSPRFVGEKLLQPIRSGCHFKLVLTEKTAKTMVEFSQPNTHKELHVGHMRNACLGQSVVNLLRYANYEIISSTFPGDVGTHVAKCLWYLKYVNQEPPTEKNRGEWLGRMYSRANLKLEDEVGTALEAQNREKLTLILRQLEAKAGEFYELWKETRQWSI